jgi:hypothetical protein
VKDEFIIGELEPLNPMVDSCYRLSLTKKIYRGKGDDHLHNQLHLHVDEFEANGNQVVIQFANVTKIEVEKEKRGLNLLVNTAITAGSIVGGLTLFLAIVCGCPHNYVYDGNNYYFNNTLFTGANAPSLERDDFKFLPDFFPDSSTYRMIIKNEENEIQYTNLLEMIAIDHAMDVKVVPTQNGRILTVQSPVLPVSAKNDAGEDATLYISSEDDLFYGFDKTGADDFSHIFAKFPVQNDGKNAKVVLRAKNSQWAGLVNRSFNTLVGKNYSKWKKKNHSKSAAELNAIREKSGIPLLFSIRQGENWIPLEAVQLVGDIAYNDVAIKIPEKYITGETVELKLSTGFKFWELDALYMDYSEPVDFSVTTFTPSSVIGTKNCKSEVSNDDHEYMIHSSKGDSAIVEFSNVPPAKEKRTLLLHSKGYYTSTEEYNGKTEWKTIAAIRRAGGLSYFSKTLFEHYSNAAKR